MARAAKALYRVTNDNDSVYFVEAYNMDEAIEIWETKMPDMPMKTIEYYGLCKNFNPRLNGLTMETPMYY